MKFLVIYAKENDEFVKEFETAEEAIREADELFEILTAHDKKHCRELYVLESENPDEDAPDHYDGNVIRRI